MTTNGAWTRKTVQWKHYGCFDLLWAEGLFTSKLVLRMRDSSWMPDAYPIRTWLMPCITNKFWNNTHTISGRHEFESRGRFFSKIASVTTPLPGISALLEVHVQVKWYLFEFKVVKSFWEPRLNNRTQDLKCLNPTGRVRFCLCSKLVTNTLHLRERCFSSCHERRTKELFALF